MLMARRVPRAPAWAASAHSGHVLSLQAVNITYAAWQLAAACGPHLDSVLATPRQQAFTVSSVRAICRSNSPSRVSVVIFTVSTADLHSSTQRTQTEVQCCHSQVNCMHDEGSRQINISIDGKHAVPGIHR